MSLCTHMGCGCVRDALGALYDALQACEKALATVSEGPGSVIHVNDVRVELQRARLVLAATKNLGETYARKRNEG